MSHDPAAATLPDGSEVLDHLGVDVTVLLLGSPAPTAGSLFDRALASGRALKVVRVPHPGAETGWGGRVVVLARDGTVAWRGDEPPADPGAVLDSVARP